MQKPSSLPSTLVAPGFHALSDPLRVQVLDLLREQELCVCDLCEVLVVCLASNGGFTKSIQNSKLEIQNGLLWDNHHFELWTHQIKLDKPLEVNQSQLSFHLKVLKEAKLLQARQEGRWIYYSLNLSQFVVLEQYLAEFRRFSPILPSRTCRD